MVCQRAGRSCVPASRGSAADKVLLVAKQDFYGFDPRPVDLFLADGFVAVAEVQTNESNELSEIVLGSGLSQIRNGHGSLPLIHREHFATETITDAHAGAKFPYFVHGFHSRKMADSLRMLLRDVGNLGVFPGNPTGSSRKDFSLAGCPRIWHRKPMGLADCIEPILRASPLIVLSLFRSVAGAGDTTNLLRSCRESHRHRIHAVAQTRRGRPIVEYMP